MSIRTVAVVHPERMVAEGIAAALARQPGIVVDGVATTEAEALGCFGRVDAVAIHEALPEAKALGARLRDEGSRIVAFGDGGASEEARVSTRSSITALAQALSPAAANGSGGQGRRPLSSREREVLHLVARGMPGKQVARQLGISPKTVEQHKAHIYSKLGVPNQAAAVHRVLVQNGGSAI